jgi:tetratricopeptide (TPR) repeat protein
MELFGTAVVGALASAMVTGAGEEAGRRSLGPMAALLGRLRLRRRTPDGDDDGGDDGQPPVLPADPERARHLAEEIVRAARDDRAIAELLERFARERTDLPPVRIAVPYADLVDRREQLVQVRELANEVRDRPLLLFLLGERHGVGTSALAKNLSHELDELLPDEHLYVDLAGTGPGQELAPATAATELLLDLRVPPERIPPHLTGKLRELRDRLRHRRALLVLDNARSAEQVTPLLVGAPGSLTVVTASHRMPALVGEYGARVLHVGPLDRTDAEELLATVAGEDRFLAGGAAAREAAWRCDGHPRTLCDVGALARLDEEPDWQAIVRELGGESADPGTEAVARAYPGLTADAARLHRLLGLLPLVSLGVPAVAALAGRAAQETEVTLGELAGRHLLERLGDRYRQTPPAHRHAAAQRVDEANRAQAVREWVTWCLRTAAEAQTSVMPGRWYLGGLAGELAAREPVYRDPAAALRALRRERPVLVAAVRVAAASDLPELAWQLCESMWALHLRLGFHDDCLTTHALGVEAARACGDRRAEARMLVQRGFSQTASRRHEDARAAYEQAFAAEPDDHPRGRATALESLGLLLLGQDRYEEAERLFRRALPFAEQAGDPRALALLAHHIGRALRGQRWFEAAREQLDRALRAMRALPVPDRYNEGRVLTSLGETRLTAGDPAAAAGPLDEALEIMTAEGALIQEAAVAELRTRCEPDGARRLALWRRTWELHEATGDAEGAERARRHLTGEDGADWAGEPGQR